MPIVRLIYNCLSWYENGLSNESRIWVMTRSVAVRALFTGCSRTPNWSPPRCASESDSRTIEFSRSATSRNKISPTSRPRVSLYILNWLISSDITTTCEPGTRREAAIARLRWSAHKARLGRFVRRSVVASRSSSLRSLIKWLMSSRMQCISTGLPSRFSDGNNEILYQCCAPPANDMRISA